MITMHDRLMQTDRRTNIMAIARWFVLTNASRAKNEQNKDERLCCGVHNETSKRGSTGGSPLPLHLCPGSARQINLCNLRSACFGLCSVQFVRLSTKPSPFWWNFVHIVGEYICLKVELDLPTVLMRSKLKDHAQHYYRSFQMMNN